MVAGAVIEGHGRMRGDPAGVVVASPGIRFPDRMASGLMVRRGRVKWARLGRLVLALAFVGRVMKAGQAPGIRGKRR